MASGSTLKRAGVWVRRPARRWKPSKRSSATGSYSFDCQPQSLKLGRRRPVPQGRPELRSRFARAGAIGLGISYNKQDHVVTITIDRYERRSAIDPAHAMELVACWERSRDDPDAWVAI